MFCYRKIRRRVFSHLRDVPIFMANRGTWKNIIQFQRFLKTKDSQVFFFANGPITVMNLKFAQKLINLLVSKNAVIG